MQKSYGFLHMQLAHTAQYGNAVCPNISIEAVVQPLVPGGQRHCLNEGACFRHQVIADE
jgi:hypothetical protein